MQMLFPIFIVIGSWCVFWWIAGTILYFYAGWGFSETPSQGSKFANFLKSAIWFPIFLPIVIIGELLDRLKN